MTLEERVKALEEQQEKTTHYLTHLDRHLFGPASVVEQRRKAFLKLLEETQGSHE